MNNRRRLTALVGAGGASPRSFLFGDINPAILRRLLSVARHSLMALGLAAIGALALMFVRPEMLDDLKALSPFSETEKEAPTMLALADLLELPAPDREADTQQTLIGMDGPSKEQQRVSAWLAKRYRIAGTAGQILVGAAYDTADAVKLDPLLILAVMAIESRFNPFAESSVGAQGLMQVMSKVHQDKFSDHGGINAALNPVANIQVGAKILRDLIRRGGSVEAGLKLYVGAGNLETDGGYTSKVMAEYARLQAVAAGKRVPTFTPPSRPAAAPEVREAKAEPSEATGADESTEPA